MVPTSLVATLDPGPISLLVHSNASPDLCRGERKDVPTEPTKEMQKG